MAGNLYLNDPKMLVLLNRILKLNIVEHTSKTPMTFVFVVLKTRLLYDFVFRVQLPQTPMTQLY